MVRTLGIKVHIHLWRWLFASQVLHHLGIMAERGLDHAPRAFLSRYFGVAIQNCARPSLPIVFNVQVNGSTRPGVPCVRSDPVPATEIGVDSPARPRIYTPEAANGDPQSTIPTPVTPPPPIPLCV